MSGISSMSGSIAQILSQNSQSANSSTGSDGSSGIEAFGGFSLYALQGSRSTGTDSMSEMTSQSEAITGQLSDSIMSMLIELQETSTTTDGNSSFDAQRLFSDMDTDGDGTLTKDEFMASAPDGVSDEMSENLWNVMAGSDAQSISEDDYLASMTPPSGAVISSDDSSEDTVMNSMLASMGSEGTYDPLDTNEDGVVSLSEIMAAAPQDATPSQSSLPDNSSEAESGTDASVETDALTDNGTSSETVARNMAENNDDSSLSTGGFDIRNEALGNKVMAQIIS
ncbi:MULTISPECIES: EF-hand domain-containing protein [Thalassospira]|uniref:EF-hand domain-containing protein n=1 Tax=Thalassospira TaxID=168934 RepID=UPI0007AD7507|nr:MULTISPECIES: EF-hand domain-containing protein [Thalassospira]KZB59901.1 hypothetical protein AUQ42_07140 [Thalassospira sp. MCCC 1A02491]MCC4242225.1 EF-hand domain-containing protein [Thalassospira povalilytica]